MLADCLAEANGGGDWVGFVMSRVHKGGRVKRTVVHCEDAMDVRQKILAYHGDLATLPTHRYRSWEHCHASLASTIFGCGQGSKKGVSTRLAEATDTLVTKVLLGTIGCLPATDKFFKKGFQLAGFSYSCVNDRFVDRTLRF